MTRILLARHGQASYGAADYDVLSAAGRQQGERLGEWFADQDEVPDRVVHGSLRRQRETWEAIAEGAGWEHEAKVDDAWDEFDATALFAAVDGATDRREFDRRFHDALGRWTAGDDTAGFTETWPDFMARVAAGFVVASQDEGTTLVVTSGGPIAAVVAGITLPDPNPEQLATGWSRLSATLVNSGFSRVLVTPDRARLLSYNESPHLVREEVTYR